MGSVLRKMMFRGGGGLNDINIIKYGWFAQVVLFLAVMFFALPVYAQIPTEGLMGYWSFDDGTANLTAGSANNGQPTSAVTFGPGKSGMAAVFQGVDNPGHIYIPNSAALQFTGGATYSAWVRADSLKSMDAWGRIVADGGASSIIAKSHDRSGAALIFAINAASQAGTWLATYESWAAGQGDPLWTPQKAVGDWTHLVYTLSASTGFNAYVDGRLYRSVANPVSFAQMNGQDLFLGKFSDTWYPFYGAIDEVRIYNRVLNESEIAELAGSSQSPGSFLFSPITSPVEPNTCFPVQVEARTASGVRDTTVNGNVSLSANYGGMSPMSISFSNGVATESCVKVYRAGENKQLKASGVGRSGQSNYFSAANATTCSGKVKFFHDEPGVFVNIKTVADVDIASDTSEEESVFYATNFDLSCGQYKVRASKDGVWRDLTVTVKEGEFFEHITLPKGEKATAVVLIPGIMGSSHKGTWGTHPYFEGNYPDKNLEIMWPSQTGWTDLRKYLNDDGKGYKVVVCPWDWRGNSVESMQSNVEKFLLPAINEALASSANTKVHIVAHSMGGLLARAYIQSSLYRDDVDKIALVAVPSLGSVNPYCLWEGGDFRTLKTIAGGDWNDDDDFYEETVKKLWNKTYKKNWKGKKTDWKSCNAPVMRDFMQTVAPSLQQLMFTGDFLLKNNIPGIHPVTVTGNVNNWLNALNYGRDGYKQPAEVFSQLSGDNGKVRARVFLGNSANSTLRRIDVENYGVGTLYPDGKPRAAGALDCDGKAKPTNSYFLNNAGDKTVPLESAQYPLTAGWADRALSTSLIEHGKIMKDVGFRVGIKDFLDGDMGGGTTDPATAALAKMATAKDLAGEPGTPVLAFSVIGDMRLLVTDAQGRRSGLEPGTGTVLNEIPEANIEANDAAASVVIENPAAGQYRLTYYGTYDQDFSLSVTAYNAAGDGVEQNFTGYRPDAPQTMTVVYTPSTVEQIVVQPVVLAPQEMEKESYTCGTGKCVRLKWKASANAGVSQYIVYRVLPNEPYYVELARVANGVVQYNTGEVWDETDDSPINGYAVSAIKADTKESFFAEDKDSEYVFPWPMFLPAVTHGSQRP